MMNKRAMNASSYLSVELGLAMLRCIPIIVFALVVCSCASQRSPTYVRADLAEKEIQSVVLFPTVLRVSSQAPASIGRSVDEAVQQAALSALASKRQDCKLFKAWDDSNSQPSKEDLLNLDPSWVRQLGPEQSRWILILAVEIDTDFAEAPNSPVPSWVPAWYVRVEGLLLDKSKGNLAWKDVEKAGPDLEIGRSDVAEIARQCAIKVVSTLPSN